MVVERRHRREQGYRNGGYAYLAVLILVCVMGISMASTATLWSRERQREREAELLFVGDQYRRAIQQYYESSPGDKRYPATLGDLLLDSRHPNPRRYLRRLFRDPLNELGDWGLVLAPEGGVMGVFSQASGTPIKRTGFAPLYTAFDERESYVDWQFSYRPETMK